MHPSFSWRAFERHQEHDLKHPSLMDLIGTKQNKQTTLLQDKCSNFLGIILIHSRWMDDKRLRTALQDQQGGTPMWSTLGAISTCHPSMKHHLCMAPPRVATSELPSKLYTATLCCSFSIDCPLESHYQQTLLRLLLTSPSQSITVLYLVGGISLFCASIEESFFLLSLVVVAKSCERDSCLRNFI